MIWNQKKNHDIKTLKTMHNFFLKQVLVKWMKTISKTFKNDKFSEYKLKPARPSDNAKKPYRPSNNAQKSKKPNTDKTKKPNTNKAKKPNTDKA